ncbi:MAG: diguanylate cyclase [Epsilonproteobacteria bacterium]|nr:diguanylate cyclase [Campylobacterota bacterium]OIO17045.1 MAG: hypothetical protein AUJ81_02835 [Helicobacteraceae bacterium CG1_02_36_14]PIP09243.1 MAG: hypothetical protein COX50_12165 [Sulfurimonas sp. CG23_combo_of_CG06-09_8_20_14_all_36_33]PIS24656.1 MAG: hypothetical protein COT46_08785 [Sulfurimonas sp. CG08_land_8_20_14_0_20_36_33]PIU35005.1 MAG: hypothetical protein COT05_05445 [Sulfurimonas sp. CG07_land_8_20_14_0_80_36_56]PIV02985.1 MAG: hypothetical protein COS56_10310 [Sulfuri
MKFTIGLKLIIAVMMPVILEVIFIFRVEHAKLDETFENLANDSFEQTIKIVENNFSFMQQSNIYMANTLLENKKIKNYLVNKNIQAIYEYLEIKVRDMNVDSLIILDKDANIIAEHGLFHIDAENLKSYSLVNEAMKNKSAVSMIERVADIFVYYTAVVIMEEDQVIGEILIGLQLSNRLLSEVKKGTNIDISIVGDRALVATSLVDENNQSITLLPLAYTEYLWLLNGNVDLLSTKMGSKEYYTKAKELSLVDKDTTNASLMMMQNKDNYNHQLSQVRFMQVSFLLILIGSLFLAVLIISLMLRKNFSKIIKGLKLISAGKYGETIEINSRDELQTIATYFNVMSQSIKEKDERIVSHVLELEEKIEENLALKDREKKLYDKATKDFLTGLFNREKFEEHLDYMIVHSFRNEKKIALVMLDIDFFKKVNDTFGHLVGDATLKKIATLLKENLRKNDICARWGGEEFMIALEVDSLESAVEITQKMRVVIASHKMDVVSKVTCSFGITLIKEDEDKKSAFLRADEALYSAKENGRNRVEVKI